MLESGRAESFFISCSEACIKLSGLFSLEISIPACIVLDFDLSSILNTGWVTLVKARSLCPFVYFVSGLLASEPSTIECLDGLIGSNFTLDFIFD